MNVLPNQFVKTMQDQIGRIIQVIDSINVLVQIAGQQDKQVIKKIDLLVIEAPCIDWPTRRYFIEQNQGLDK